MLRYIVFGMCVSLLHSTLLEGGLLQVAIDRFQNDKSDPSVIVFSEIKRCQLPNSTQFFQKAILR